MEAGGELQKARHFWLKNFLVFMLLVCELHVHTDCILFACSDCRQCHQDGHQDHVSVDASAAERGYVFLV